MKFSRLIVYRATRLWCTRLTTDSCELKEQTSFSSAVFLFNPCASCCWLQWFQTFQMKYWISSTLLNSSRSSGYAAAARLPFLPLGPGNRFVGAGISHKDDTSCQSKPGALLLVSCMFSVERGRVCEPERFRQTYIDYTHQRSFSNSFNFKCRIKLRKTHFMSIKRNVTK